MKNFFKFFKFIAMGSFSLILTACYGVMYGVPFDWKNCRVKVKDITGRPIPGLKVSTESGYVSLTDVDGIAQMEFYDEEAFSIQNLTVQDIDGTGNGGEFASQNLQVDLSQEEEEIRIDIVLEEGDSDSAAAGTGTRTVNINVNNSNDIPLQGISIVVYDQDYHSNKIFELVTDDSGRTSFDYSLLSTGYSLYVKDIDGWSNHGSYEDKDLVVTVDSISSPITVNIVLDLVE